ncbi:hypothetical protein AgCh_010963 [Apium graveolens]
MSLLQKRFRKNSNSLSLKKRRKRMVMMKQSNQVEKKDVMLGVVGEDTEILDAQERPDDSVMDLEVSKVDKKMKGIMISCCKQEDLPKYDVSNSKHTFGEASSGSCDVCMAVFSISDFIRGPSCNHKFCKDCIETYVLKQIQEDAMNVACPGSKCKEVLKPNFCRKVIPEQVFDRWKSEINLATSFLRRKIQCPNIDCEEEFMDDGKGYNIRACPHCWNLICMPCGRVEWHLDEDCETFRRRKKSFSYGLYGRRLGRQHDPYLQKKHGLNNGRLDDDDSPDYPYWSLFPNLK